MDDAERPRRRKPGPKAEIPNPHPAGDPPENVITPDLLAYEVEQLRDCLGARRRELTPSAEESPGRAIWRISDIVEQAIDRTCVGWWSALQHEKVREPEATVSGLPKGVAARYYYLRHVGPNEPTKRPQHGAVRVFHEKDRKLLKRYDKESKSWTFVCELDESTATVVWIDALSQPMAKVTWWFPALRPKFEAAVRRMLTTPNLGRVGRSGRPHYLACSVLAVLLDTTPEKVHDRLHHHRRRKRRSTGGA
jgi:hypothetical protein